MRFRAKLSIMTTFRSGKHSCKTTLGLLVFLLDDGIHAFVVVALAEHDAVAYEEVAVARGSVEVHRPFRPGRAIGERPAHLLDEAPVQIVVVIAGAMTSSMGTETGMRTISKGLPSASVSLRRIS